jgi:N-acetylneuraminic acid mutarotase
MIYVFGGSLVGAQNEGWVSTVDVYNPANDTWAKKADMPTKRGRIAASVLDGKIYVMGGEGENEVLLRTVEEYDPAKNEWTKMAAMPTARRGLAVTAVRGKLYAIGGADKGADFLDAFNLGDSPAFATVEEFTPPGWPFAVSPQGKLATMWGTIKATD